MGRCKDLSDSVKNQIVAARRLGRSISETARQVGCSRSAVVNTFRQWTEEGHITSRRQGVGRPRLIDKRGQRRLSRLVQTDSRATVTQVAKNFNDGYGVNVSHHTVHRTLLRMGLRRRRSSKQKVRADTCPRETAPTQDTASASDPEHGAVEEGGGPDRGDPIPPVQASQVHVTQPDPCESRDDSNRKDELVEETHNPVQTV